jgi:hypothetical protein
VAGAATPTDACPPIHSGAPGAVFASDGKYMDRSAAPGSENVKTMPNERLRRLSVTEYVA